MAIRRRRNTSAPRGQGGGGGAGSAALLQNTVWDWLVPGAGFAISVGFDIGSYNIPGSQTGTVTIQDVIELANSGQTPPCNFPVYPQVSWSGLLIKTNIQAFMDYADVPAANIPQGLADTITLFSDKGRYIGCDNGSPNVSQSNVRLKVDGPKIIAIQSISNTECIISLAVSQDPADLFVGQDNQPFYPYNSQTTQVGGVPFFGETYLNQGSIQTSGIRARYNPGPKFTSSAGGALFPFSLGQIGG